MDRMKEVQELCNAVAGMAMHCDDDLCGDHREYYNPRIKRAMSALIRLYPQQFVQGVAASE